MKQLTLFFALAAAVLGTGACVNLNGSGNNPYKALDLSTKSAELARQGNTFAFQFIDRVSDATADDYIISPLSMQFLLGMILNGAQGDTADEICKVLGYGAGEVDDVNTYCLAMLQQLPGLDKKTKLSIANAIFVNQQYQLRNEYKQAVGRFYEAEATNLDFSKNTAATNLINDWCSKHTNGLVPKVLDNVEPAMLAYLLNAMYFKSEWKQKFSKSNTEQEPFTNESGTKKKVPMMKTEKSFGYQDNDVLRAVRLPYGNGAFSMTVILPAEGKKLSDVTDYLSGENWEAFVRTMVGCEVDLWLPKFETKFHIKLNDILSAMGMPLSFLSKAEFSPMSPQALCLSFVQQDAVIKVDEEGTEAAVVSSAGMMAMSAAPGQHVVFHADRPFLYLITESSTGAVLFAGRYSGK